MDLRLLRYFMACVDHRTMHAAAQAVHISQPALSKAIADLETSLGVALFERRPRGVAPTPYGETLYRYAKMIDSEFRRAVAEIEAMRGATRGAIVVGVIPTMTSLMGQVARSVLEQHPGLKLKLRVAFSAELTTALLEGEVDVAILLLPEGESPPGLAFEPLIGTRPVVVVRKGHPLAARSNITLQDLAGFPWLIPDYPASHKASVHRAYLDAGLPPPEAAISVSTAVFVDALLLETDLVSVVPSALLGARARSDLAALDVGFAFPPERVGLAFRERSTVLPGAKAVISLIRARCLAIDTEAGWERAEPAPFA